MAISRVALGTAQGKPATTLSLTTGAVLASDFFVLLVASDGGVSQAFFGAARVTATNAGNVVVQIFDAFNNQGDQASLNFDLTPNASGDAVAACIIALRGLAISPFDKSSTGTGNGTSPSSGATAPLAQADEICIGAIGTEGPPTDAAGTWSNSFNAGQRDGSNTAGATSNATISEGYLIVSATTAQTAAKTSITSRDWAAAIATYKGAAVVNIPNKLYEYNQAVKRSNFY